MEGKDGNKYGNQHMHVNKLFLKQWHRYHTTKHDLMPLGLELSMPFEFRMRGRVGLWPLKSLNSREDLGVY